jgi:N-acetylglucosaminyldiphosphoundecaprenol N-acetyl-beta-D-mannosaminyltransferase
MHKATILNCAIDNYSFDELLKDFTHGIFVSANVHMLMYMQTNRNFYNSYRSDAYCINDSKIIFALSKFLKTPLRSTIPGSDFFPAFCEYHKNNPDVRIFLLGARPGVAKKAQSIMNQKIGREIIVGEYSPPFGFENDPEQSKKIKRLIHGSDATALVVGLSAPKGEVWVSTHRDDLQGLRWIICAGAAIDFAAGAVRRAPRAVRAIGLEWFFRIYQEPFRLWKRYLIEDMPFFWLFFKQLLGIYKNPFK